MVCDGKVLSLNAGNGVGIGDVVNTEIAGGACGKFSSGFRADHSSATPWGELVFSGWASGVCLGGKLGHAVFVVNMAGGDLEKIGELLIEFLFFKGAGGSFVATCFEKMGAGRKRDGVMALDEMEECESRSH